MKNTNSFATVRNTIASFQQSFTAGVLGEPYAEKSKQDILSNLKKNWYFPISAMAFFCLSAALNLGYILGLFFAFAFALFVSMQVPSLWKSTKKYSTRLKVFSLISAVGICMSIQSSFYTDLMQSPKTQALMTVLPAMPFDIPALVTSVAAVVSLFFVYFCLLIFWNRITDLFREAGFFAEIRKSEWIIYGLLLIVSLVYMVLCYAKTVAFYGNDYVHDIIYTSDSRMLVKWNAYMTLTHQENDLRQPLFAVFSAPFTAIPYLVSRLIGASAAVHGMLMNSVQVAMLFVTNLILAAMMKLDMRKRICFMVLSCFTYAQLLFTLMMEQYIVACFWLVFCVYLIARNRTPARITLWATGGTLLTGMILLPFMSKASPIRNFKAWFLDMLKYGIEFVLLLLAFCRFDVIFNLFSEVGQLTKFTGATLTFADKLYQYTRFVSNCFFAPEAGIFENAKGDISWQLHTASGIHLGGVIILLLVLVSVILNRDKKSSLLAAGWVGFSIVLLLGLGWGTSENGLILYALYFGWAFFVLLFQLFERIETALNIRFLIPVASAIAAAVMLVVNVPAMMEMIHFAVTYFPT